MFRLCDTGKDISQKKPRKKPNVMNTFVHKYVVQLYKKGWATADITTVVIGIGPTIYRPYFMVSGSCGGYRYPATDTYRPKKIRYPPQYLPLYCGTLAHE